MGFPQGKMARRIAKVKNARAGKTVKLDIRHRVLDAIGRDVAVFDAFAGSGEMFRNVWHAARGYVGCDLEWHRDGRLLYVGDNRRVMRCIDLAPYAIFDLDAHGSPWATALIIAARRSVAPGERIGIVVTEGSGLSLKAGKLPRELAELVGMGAGRFEGLLRWQDELVARAFNRIAGRMHCIVEAHWQAKGATGAAIIYAGVVMRGRPAGDA